MVDEQWGAKGAQWFLWPICLYKQRLVKDMEWRIEKTVKWSLGLFGNGSEEGYLVNFIHSRDIKIRKKIFPFKEFHSQNRPYLDVTDSQLRAIKEFNNKVSNGNVDFETVPCLCGGTVFDLIASVDRYSMLQRTVLCTKCGLIQACPRMTKKEYSNFYSSDYYRKTYGSDEYLHLLNDSQVVF